MILECNFTTFDVTTTLPSGNSIIIFALGVGKFSESKNSQLGGYVINEWFYMKMDLNCFDCKFYVSKSVQRLQFLIGLQRDSMSQPSLVLFRDSIRRKNAHFSSWPVILHHRLLNNGKFLNFILYLNQYAYKYTRHTIT